MPYARTFNSSARPVVRVSFQRPAQAPAPAYSAHVPTAMVVNAVSSSSAPAAQSSQSQYAQAQGSAQASTQSSQSQYAQAQQDQASAQAPQTSMTVVAPSGPLSPAGRARAVLGVPASEPARMWGGGAFGGGGGADAADDGAGGGVVLDEPSEARVRSALPVKASGGGVASVPTWAIGAGAVLGAAGLWWLLKGRG